MAGREERGSCTSTWKNLGCWTDTDLATAWNTLFGADATAAPFIEALEKIKCPVVIDWGFPPEHLDAVRKLFKGGVMLWWFAADWAVARRKVQRTWQSLRPVEDFDIQIQKIEAALPEINALFRVARGVRVAFDWHLHPTRKNLGKA